MRPQRSGDRVPRHSEAGFSLIEVMSALVILGIAITAVFATFISQQRSFTVQNWVAEMQQNLRQAVEYMSRDIRLAGYGIPDNVVIPNNIIAAGVTSVRSIYAKDNTTGPDQVYILYTFDMDANQPSTTLAAAGGTGGSVTVDNTTGFLSGGEELVLITDGTTADLFQTTAAGGGVLTFGAGAYNTGHTKLYGVGPPPSTVSKARFVRYFIDNTTDPAHPTLMVDRNIPGQTAQPLADDIEDMQLTYAVDLNGNDFIDSGEWTPTPANLSQIRQVRLQFIARTRLPEAGWSETRPGTAQGFGNRTDVATPDAYRRRIYDIVIDVRNSGV
jgi:prepilin-type N-terminal cleavage/methylation domain-containing protein